MFRGKGREVRQGGLVALGEPEFQRRALRILRHARAREATSQQKRQHGVTTA
jgi:hypothetical protein